MSGTDYSSKKTCIPIRSIIWIMLFTCTMVLYMLRINISLILLAMVDSGGTSTDSVPECKALEMDIPNGNESVVALRQTGDQIHRHGPTYAWDPKLQGLILGAYFWGFVVSNLPGGAIAERWGPRKCVAISFGVSSVLTLLGPLCTSIHPYLLITSRLLIGLFGGVVYPAIHCLISKWAPPAEKGKFISATLGSSLGTVITWPLLGAIMDRLSWTWAFYISGLIVLLWTIIWCFVVYDSPKDHPWIADQELDYITSSFSGTVSTKKRVPPYKSIAVSVPAWALCVAQFGSLWGLFFLMTAGPKFMSTVLGFNLGHTGFLAALPYLARMIAGFLFGSLGDFITRRNLMSKTTTLKTFILFSHALPGLLLISQTFVGCHVNWVIVLITLSLASNGASTITNLSNPQNLAPNFAGSLYGITNCIGSTTGFISPMIVGYLTAEHNGLDEWHIIFYIGALVYIGCGIVFFIFGSAKIQTWNFSEEELTAETSPPHYKSTGGFDNVALEHKA